MTVNGASRPATATLRPGQTLALPGGVGSITFAGFSEFATFQVTHDPGSRLALAAAVLLLIGLVVSLRVRRRRLWLRARPDGRRTVVEAAGLSRNDSGSFDEDFRAIITRLRSRPAAPEED